MRVPRHLRVASLLVTARLLGCSVPVPQSAPDRPRAAATQPALPPAAPLSLRPITRLTAVVSRPLVFHLPGIGGALSIDRSMVNGLVAGGFKGDVEIYDWTEGDSGIHALRSLDRNRGEAKQIAALLLAHHLAQPAGQIYITCHSGGAGLAVWALEDLPPSVQVERVVFLSPALSPDYNLTAALRHVASKAYVFSSESDNLILGYGTRVFGTIDGIKTDAAGRVGFRRPASGDVEQYAKLVSLPYNPDWVRYHDLGDHIGGMTRAFGQQVLLPLILSGTLPHLSTTIPTAALPPEAKSE